MDDVPTFVANHLIPDDRINLYNFIYEYFVNGSITSLKIDRHPTFTFCGLISGGAFAREGTDLVKLFNDTLGHVISEIVNLSGKDEQVVYG